MIRNGNRILLLPVLSSLTVTVFLQAAGTADAQPTIADATSHGVPIQYLGEGQLLDSLSSALPTEVVLDASSNPCWGCSGTPSPDAVGTTVNGVTIANTAQGCHDYCDGTYGSGGGSGIFADLVGFSYYRGADATEGTSDDACRCYRVSGASIETSGELAAGTAATHGWTWCFACQSEAPSQAPSQEPSVQPSSMPSEAPSGQPSSSPSIQPSSIPSESPSIQPSSIPSSQPSEVPSGQPSSIPSEAPSGQPSSLPSEAPSGQPSSIPSEAPSGQPSSIPSESPSGQPSSLPSEAPSGQPSSIPSEAPSGQPSSIPSEAPSSQPSSIPSEAPSGQPSSIPSGQPSSIPSEAPSGQPSSLPSEAPSGQPSSIPSAQPSSIPSEAPSGQPSSIPSSQPSSAPSEAPSSQPSSIPSSQPSSIPSASPSSQPSSIPSSQPSSQPSESPSANPSQGCENIRTDCGWGIFNPWTCRCDCPVGICLDNNEQCYHPCRETIHTNPWAGCSPGWDCPWFPDADHGHCISELHQPNNFEIYRTSKECCDKHYPNSASCVQESKDSHDPFPWPIHFPGTQPWTRPFRPPEAEDIWGTEAGNGPRWFPDLINKLNCVHGGNYESWMTTDGYEVSYLFDNAEDCCELWYPARTDCPDNVHPVNPEAEDEPWHSAPYSMDNYYYPDFSVNNCGHGRDYPAWMGINGYEKHYLFRSGEECCSKYFPNMGGCPFEHEMQLDYHWTTYEDNIYNLDDMPVRYNHTYYPDINAGTCVNGTDYPSWMSSDRDFIRLYLFKSLDGCCTHWFTDFGLQGCMNNVMQGIYDVEPCHTNRPDCNHVQSITNVTEHRLGMWYPDIDGSRCKNDGQMASWMRVDEYAEWYLFNTRQQCCEAFGFC